MHGVYDYIITHNFKIGLKYFQPIIDVPNLALLTYNTFFLKKLLIWTTDRKLEYRIQMVWLHFFVHLNGWCLCSSLLNSHWSKLWLNSCNQHNVERGFSRDRKTLLPSVTLLPTSERFCTISVFAQRVRTKRLFYSSAKVPKNWTNLRYLHW